MIDAALPPPPPLPRFAREGSFVMQIVLKHLHEDQ